MPNWCDLDVMMYGSKETLEAIRDKGAEGTYERGSDWNKETRKYDTIENLPNTFSFANFAPIPTELKDTNGMSGGMEELGIAISQGRAGEYTDWYSWCIGNWGTKWDLDQFGATSVSEEITETETVGVYKWGVGGSTAWSPAFQIFQTISEQYPVKIVYQYAEEGMCFFGRAVIENGEVVEDDYREITSEDYKIAGATRDEEGNVDWDNTDEYDLYKVFA